MVKLCVKLCVKFCPCCFLTLRACHGSTSARHALPPHRNTHSTALEFAPQSCPQSGPKHMHPPPSSASHLCTGTRLSSDFTLRSKKNIQKTNKTSLHNPAGVEFATGQQSRIAGYGYLEPLKAIIANQGIKGFHSFIRNPTEQMIVRRCCTLQDNPPKKCLNSDVDLKYI